MSKSRLLAAAAFLFVNQAFAQNYGYWEAATFTGQSPTGDAMLTRCSYRTLGGYEFSIIVRGICPFSVQVNPETGQVKR